MTPSLMRREIDEIPEAARRLLNGSADNVAKIAEELRRLDPRVVVTIARGSSDNAALFLKYAIERTMGLPLASIYGVRFRLDRAVALAISQSGESPDILAMARSAGEGGALTIALTNTTPSPLSEACRCGIDIAAGPERSVAATKSFVNSVLAGLCLLARWGGDEALGRALDRFPDQLADALRLDWSSLGGVLDSSASLFVLGRGPAIAMAAESALKFKETCGLHAESYSAAEVQHGPVELVGSSFPVLVLAARDAAEPSVMEVAEQLARGGVPVCATSDRAERARPLPFVATGHPLTDALALIVPFYGFAESLSRRLGRDPDRPAHLRKVTQTL